MRIITLSTGEFQAVISATHSIDAAVKHCTT
jgi:hypothetical protein